jgi:hypothetical protein
MVAHELGGAVPAALPQWSAVESHMGSEPASVLRDLLLKAKQTLVIARVIAPKLIATIHVIKPKPRKLQRGFKFKNSFSTTRQK